MPVRRVIPKNDTVVTTYADRRACLQKIAGVAAMLGGLGIGGHSFHAIAAAQTGGAPTQLRKTIPSSGESIAPIGMGTWITFNVGNDPALLNQRANVLREFFAAGGGMIDSSPMYGSAEQVLGELLTRPDAGVGSNNLFAATKVWTGDSGAPQIQESTRLWQREQFDLLQVHNLLNWQEHLPLLMEMKAAGAVRYVGITTSHGRRHQDMEQVMRNHPVDFVQLTYNPVDREAEQQLLPLARDKGIAVIANRPFQRGALTRRLASKPLPTVASELGCNTWAELLLKFTISHPAVTCVIPATSRVDHMQQNMRAGRGAIPTDAQRAEIVDAVG